jgi:hypothetical protein
MKARREIFEVHYRCYQQTGKKDKGKILDGIAGTTGLNRNYLAHVLAGYGKKPAAEGEGRPAHGKREPGKHGGRPPQYQDKAVAALLTRVRENHGRALRQTAGTTDTGHYRLSCRVERA